MPLDLQKGFFHPFFHKKHLLFGVNNTPCKIIFGVKIPLTWRIYTPAVTVVEPSADSVREAKVETVSVLLPIADIVLVIDKDHDM